jgi:hypothetical protein
MSLADNWAVEIGIERDSEGHLNLGSVIMHIRDAIIETGFVSRGRITSGLKEAYRPLGVEDVDVRAKIDEALRVLVLSGDVDEFTTAAGRGYAPTPPRRVAWGGAEDVLLGSTSGGEGTAYVRRLAAMETDETIVKLSLDEELGRPEWRLALVELKAADAPGDPASALFEIAVNLAASGDRYSLDEPEMIAVLSGRGTFFGHADRVPSGRWQRFSSDGCFPAVIKSGFSSRHVVLNIRDGMATVWEPKSYDLWKWVVVGATLAAGDAVINYDPDHMRLNFLTPPPNQVERAALLTGSQVGPWSWDLDVWAFAVIEEIIGSPR